MSTMAFPDMCYIPRSYIFYEQGIPWFVTAAISGMQVIDVEFMASGRFMYLMPIHIISP